MQMNIDKKKKKKGPEFAYIGVFSSSTNTFVHFWIAISVMEAGVTKV